MTLRLFATFLLMLIVQGVSAQDPDQSNAFNSAWNEYVEAVQSGQNEPAIEAARKVLGIGKDIFSANDERIAVLTQNYGSALLAGEQKKKAREQLELALDLIEAQHGEDSTKLISVLGELADASGGVGDDFKQMKFYKRALKITADEYGDSSQEYGALAFRAARNVYEQSHSQIGKKYMEAAQEIFLAEFGEADPRVGMAYLYLGKMRFSKRQYKQAAGQLEAALPSFGGESPDEKSIRLITRALLVQSYESWGKSELATPHCVAIGSESQIDPDQDYKPIFRIAPQYPGELLVRGVEGFVDFEFTIDENGFVQNPVVIASVPDRLRDRGGLVGNVRKDDLSFDAAATDAIERFRYAPRFVDGEAVPVDGVKTRISFQLVD